MITVVIPVYNRPEELRRALQSLVEQTVHNFEVIVCDDGSEVDVRSVVNSFIPQLDIRYFRIENSGGPARPRNVGVAHASGEWISFLDSDDWWAADRFEVVSKHLSSEIDILYHRLEFASGKSDNLFEKILRRKHTGRAIIGNPFSDMLSRGNSIPNSSVIVRKSLLNKIGGICEDSSYASFEDFDAWLTLAKMGARFKFVEQSLGYYWIGADNISVASDKQIIRQRSLFKRHCQNLPGDLGGWAKSYDNYVVGTYLLNLGRAKDALASFKEADQLRYGSQRFYRFVKICLAEINILFAKVHR